MADHNEDFVSFEKALRDLQMKSEELKKLVSEGDIRAFRDGQTMKFRREDIDALSSTGGRADALVFEDLEDDTGMVTEELSDEDTLLAEDDLLDDEPEVAAKPRRERASSAGSRRAAVAVPEETTEPMWVTAAAVLCAVAMIYGLMIAYSIAMGDPPQGLTGVFAAKN